MPRCVQVLFRPQWVTLHNIVLAAGGSALPRNQAENALRGTYAGQGAWGAGYADWPGAQVGDEAERWALMPDGRSQHSIAQAS